MEDLRQITLENIGVSHHEKDSGIALPPEAMEGAPKFMRQSTDKHGSVSRTFFLPANDTKVRACKAFSCQLYLVSASTIVTAMKKKQVTPFITNDKRGRKVSGNKLPDVQIDKVLLT